MTPQPITVNWHLITTCVARDDHIILNVGYGWSVRIYKQIPKTKRVLPGRQKVFLDSSEDGYNAQSK